MVTWLKLQYLFADEYALCVTIYRYDYEIEGKGHQIYRNLSSWVWIFFFWHREIRALVILKSADTAMEHHILCLVIVSFICPPAS